MFRFGTVCEKDSAGCLLRVEFEEDSITTDWLRMVVPAGAKNSFFAMPDVGEQVACLMDERCENGVVMGAVYSNTVKPKQAGDDVSSAVFSDGTKVVYNRSSHLLLVETVGDIQIKTSANVSVECTNLDVQCTNVDVQCTNATVTATTTKVDSPNSEFTGNVKVGGGLTVKGNGTIAGGIVANSIAAQGDIRAGGGLVGLLTHIHPTPSGPSGIGAG